MIVWKYDSMYGVTSCWHPCRAGSSGLELSWKWDYETKSPSCARGRDFLAQLDPHVWKSYYNYYSDGKSLDEKTRETLNSLIDARGHGVTSKASANHFQFWKLLFLKCPPFAGNRPSEQDADVPAEFANHGSRSPRPPLLCWLWCQPPRSLLQFLGKHN